MNKYDSKYWREEWEYMGMRYRGSGIWRKKKDYGKMEGSIWEKERREKDWRSNRRGRSINRDLGWGSYKERNFEEDGRKEDDYGDWK